MPSSTAMDRQPLHYGMTKMKNSFKVKCNDCGKLLSGDFGNGRYERRHGATFDSDLPSKRQTKFITYAHCDKCYNKLRKDK